MKKLRRILEIVGLSANGRAQELMRSWDTIPTNKLYLVRHAAFVEGRDYYLQENRDWMELSAKMDEQIAFWSTVRWLDNMAFSFAIRAYFGANGDIAEAIATPLYDLLIDFIGERSMDYVWSKRWPDFHANRPVDFTDTIRLVLQMGENYAWAVLTDGFSDGNPKKTVPQIGGMIAAAYALNFARLYFFDENTGGDFYKSFVKAVGSMELNLLKSAMIYFFVGKVYTNSKRLKPMLEQFVKYDTGIKNLLLKQIPNGGQTAESIAERLAEAAVYSSADTMSRVTEDFMLWLRSVDNTSEQKLSEKIEIFWNENERTTISLTALLRIVCDGIMERFGLKSLIDRITAEKLPPEQPYVSDEDTKKTFEEYGIAPK